VLLPPPGLTGLVETVAERVEQLRGERVGLRTPVLIGLAGGVSVGKTTLSLHLAEHLGSAGSPSPWLVEVVSSDSFLRTNSELERMGGAMVKGHPISYDWTTLERFVVEVAAGNGALNLPVYSHDRSDLLEGVRRVITTPDVVVIEGLNVLQGPPVAPVDLRSRMDLAIYVEVPAEVAEEWFVDRFHDLVERARTRPGGFYDEFVDMPAERVEAIARWAWHEVNLPNLEQHIAQTRDHADLVVHLGVDHGIVRIDHR
jgi:type I pantothenate kinase